MTYHTTHTWRDVGVPTVVPLDESVSLFYPGPAHSSGVGYCLHFEPRHIPTLKRVIRDLEHIADKERSRQGQEAQHHE